MPKQRHDVGVQKRRKRRDLLAQLRLRTRRDQKRAAMSGSPLVRDVAYQAVRKPLISGNAEFLRRR